MSGRGGPGGRGEVEVEAAFRRESGAVLAALARSLGDLDAAEDAVQEAFLEALRTWPTRGAPANPAAWITTTARNRALDGWRREAKRPAKEAAAREAWPPDDLLELEPIADDQLRLLFTCCHPALAPASQVALTLRLVCGLRTEEIARAFLQPEATIGQRVSRAKAKIRAAGIPFRVPPAHLLPDRVPVVLRCAYLVFNEGYRATAGQALVRDDLCDEGVRLARLLVELLPDEPEALGLLALVVLQDSRRSARLDTSGDLVTLEHQDRSAWDPALVEEGLAVLEVAVHRRTPGPYQLQAVVAAEHARAATWEATDWVAIAAAYRRLAELAPSPVVELNRAVAVGFADGPAAGLAVLAAVADDPRLARTHQLPAVRAALLERAGRHAEAATEYERASSLAPTGPERRHLDANRRRLLSGSREGSPPAQGPTAAST